MRWSARRGLIAFSEMLSMICVESYHGWLIELICESAGYTFRCQHPQTDFSAGDGQYYGTYEQALQVARLRADLESVRFSLSHFLNSKLQLLLLSPAERLALQNSLEQCVSAVSHQRP